MQGSAINSHVMPLRWCWNHTKGSICTPAHTVVGSTGGCLQFYETWIGLIRTHNAAGVTLATAVTTGTAFWGNTAKAMYAHLFLCLKNHTRLAQWDFGSKELCLLVHTALGRLAVVFRKAEYLGSRMWPGITLYKLVTKRRWMIINTSTLSQTNHWSQWRKRALRESKQISHIGNRHILQQ